MKLLFTFLVVLAASRADLIVGNTLLTDTSGSVVQASKMANG